MAKAKMWYLCNCGEQKFGKGVLLGVKVSAPRKGKSKCGKCNRKLEFRGKGSNSVG